MGPEFTVILPTYNSSRYVVKAIESVLGQTLRDYEIIVVDDGSTDDTVEALRPYSRRIRYFRKENGGVSSARNFGIEKARGSYIAFLDADDRWTEDKLEEVKKAFRTHPAAGLVYSGAYLVDDGCATIGELGATDLSRRAYERLLQGASLVTSSVVVKKECFGACGLFYEGFEARAGAEDWDMWIRIARDYEVRGIFKPLVYYRVHGGNTSKREFVKLNRDILLVLDRAFGRDRKPGGWTRRKAYGNAFYLRGRKYLNAIVVDEARRELAESLRLNPFQLKTYVLMLSTLLGKESVRAIRRLYRERRS